MIPRYSRPQMVALWTPERRYQTWLEVELAAGRAMAEAGLVPREAIEQCAAKGGTFSPQDAARIDEIEKTTRHDVIAFLTFLEERIGPPARHLHFGMTSSDVVDTSLAMLLRDAADLLLGCAYPVAFRRPRVPGDRKRRIHKPAHRRPHDL